MRESLEQWDKGRRLIVNMEIGGRTQYKTRVQGMPREVCARVKTMIGNFIWGENKNPLVSLDIMATDMNNGGKKVLDIDIRNEAIELMKLQRYLNTDQNRLAWAYVHSRRPTTSSKKREREHKTEQLPKKQHITECIPTIMANISHRKEKYAPRITETDDQNSAKTRNSI